MNQHGSDDPGPGPSNVWNGPGMPHTAGFPGPAQYGQAGPMPPPKSNRTLIIVLIAVFTVVVLLAILVAFLLFSGSSQRKAEEVLSSCTEQVPGSNAAALTADEQSIQYSSGKYADAADYLLLLCLLEETGAPSAVEARMDSTRALDGTQDAEWDGWSAFWTYHPDAGINATFTVE